MNRFQEPMTRRLQSVCVTENRILVTLDLDFSNIRAYPPDEYAGIVVLRLKTQDKSTVLSYIRRISVTLSKAKP